MTTENDLLLPLRWRYVVRFIFDPATAYSRLVGPWFAARLRIGVSYQHFWQLCPLPTLVPGLASQVAVSPSHAWHHPDQPIAAGTAVRSYRSFRSDRF